MTNQEINEAVARKLGWVQCCNPMTMENGKIVNCFGWSKGGSHFHAPYPDYCHSIAAAWEIVDKIEWFCLEKSHDGDKWSVWDMAGTEEAQMICEAESAPMAICLAFLKLPVESNVANAKGVKRDDQP